MSDVQQSSRKDALVDAINRLNSMANYGKLSSPLKKEVQAIADSLTPLAVAARSEKNATSKDGQGRAEFEREALENRDFLDRLAMLLNATEGHDLHQKILNAIASLERDAADAARWRWWIGKVGAVNNELKYPTPDLYKHLRGVNLMKGSVAGHVNAAVDAAIEANRQGGA